MFAVTVGDHGMHEAHSPLWAWECGTSVSFDVPSEFSSEEPNLGRDSVLSTRPLTDASNFMLAVPVYRRSDDASRSRILDQSKY